jgi:hypothetical protein
VHSEHLDSVLKHSSIIVMCCFIDVMFLIGKYEGIMIIAIDIDADRQMVPLAFAIMEKENIGSWGWLLRLV